jgi:hypothetical protein
MDLGLPHQASHTLTWSDQPAGHKILCAEMPKTVWQVHYHILRLSESHQAALQVFYAVNLKPSGGYWNIYEKAKTMRWSVNALRVKVSRARRILYHRIYGLTVRQLESNKRLECVSVT